MVEIECLVCGKNIQIPEFIDTDNYDGQVACRECASLLHVKLVGARVRKYEVVEKGLKSSATDDKITVEPEREEPAIKKASIEDIAKYNPLRDYLASYRAAKLLLSFEQIESIIGCELEKGAYTFKSWWENDRSLAQAFAWLEAGWQVNEVDLPQRHVIFRREPKNEPPFQRNVPPKR